MTMNKWGWGGALSGATRVSTSVYLKSITTFCTQLPRYMRLVHFLFFSGSLSLPLARWKEERGETKREKREEKRAFEFCSTASQTFRQINRGRREWRLWVTHTGRGGVCLCVENHAARGFDRVDSLHAGEHLRTHKYLPGRECNCVDTSCWL